MKMFSTFLRVMLTSAVDSLSFRYSRINVCVVGDRSASLDFCAESCFQQNCFRINSSKHHLKVLHPDQKYSC